MSDETQTTETTAPEAAPEAPAERSQSDERMERATARIERQLGTEPAPAPVVETETPAAPSRAAAPPRPATEHPTTVNYRERQRIMLEQARRDGMQQTLRRLEEQMAQVAARQAEPAAPGEPEDPEPTAETFATDWDFQKAWIAWNGRQQQKQILAEMQKQVGPVLDQVKRANETQEQYQERVQQETAVRGEMERRRSLFVSSEQDYAQTPEGDGYYDRFMVFYGHPGIPERGEPPYDGILTRALVRGGVPLEDARKATFMSVQALGEVGVRYGIPPALMVDGYMREVLEGAAAFLQAGNGNGAAHAAAPATPAVHPKATAGQREIAELKAAAKTAAPVAGSVKDSASGRAPGPVNWKVIAKQGRGAVEEILKDRYGDNWKKGLSDMRKAAYELKQLQGS